MAVSEQTLIEWADATWNPVTGCEPVSAGCDNCYARKLAARFPTIHGSPNFSEVLLHRERLEVLLRWRKPRTVFVCSMGDLMHPHVGAWTQQLILDVMRATPQHRYLITTKRPQGYTYMLSASAALPSNLWVGTTIENAEYQQRLHYHRAVDRAAQGAGTWLNLEPLLAEPMCEPIALANYVEAHNWLPCWVVVGGESGPHAREMPLDWVYDIVRQCHDAAVPLFIKQLGAFNAKRMGLRHPRGGDPAEWPEQLRVRQYPWETVNAETGRGTDGGMDDPQS